MTMETTIIFSNTHISSLKRKSLIIDTQMVYIKDETSSKLVNFHYIGECMVSIPVILCEKLKVDVPNLIVYLN